MSRSAPTPLHRFHRDLLEAYGPQGWWPLLGHPGGNPTKTGSSTGYHPGDYSFPRDDAERFEICVGAILTQNTAWPNVEKALRALDAAAALNPEAILRLPEGDLAALVRPSGYHNAKARKLKELAAFFSCLQGRTPARSDLLLVWGIGPETADSILLYAYGQPEMVVDAYTRRVLEHLGWVTPPISYESLKRFCIENLPQGAELYQEFHALIVEHAKRMKTDRTGDWRTPTPGGASFLLPAQAAVG
jgi:endonuclease III related protein